MLLNFNRRAGKITEKRISTVSHLCNMVERGNCQYFDYADYDYDCDYLGK